MKFSRFSQIVRIPASLRGRNPPLPKGVASSCYLPKVRFRSKAIRGRHCMDTEPLQVPITCAADRSAGPAWARCVGMRGATPDADHGSGGSRRAVQSKPPAALVRPVIKTLSQQLQYSLRALVGLRQDACGRLHQDLIARQIAGFAGEVGVADRAL